MSQAVRVYSGARPSQRAAGYIGGGGRERCAECRFFMPASSCARIQGPVSARGWCRYYSRELSVLRYTPQGAIGGSGVPAGLTLDLNFMAGSLDPSLTFTRGSVATYFDATGVMRTAAMNFLLTSEDFTSGFWIPLGQVVAVPTVTANQTTAPNGTLTADRIVYPAVSGATAFSLVYQQLTASVATYAYSVYLRGAVGGESVYISASTGGTTWYSSPRLTLTTQWQRFSVVTPALTAAVWIFDIGTDLRDVSQASTSAQTVYAWGAQVEIGSVATPYIPTTSVPNGAPRFDNDPVTHAALGLLIEEQRINQAFPSVLATPAWTATSATLGGSVTLPNGTASTTALIAATDTTNTVRSMNAAFPFVSVSVPCVLSAYMKAGPSNGYFQVNSGGAAGAAYFDLTNGTAVVGADLAGGLTAKSVSITPVGNGWYRCNYAFTTTASATGANPYFGPCTVVSGTGDNRSAVGVVGQGVYVWGAQLEVGAFPTSYIPTTAAAVTRNADQCSIQPAQMGWFTPPGGSWATEFLIKNTVADNFRIIIHLPGASGSVSPTIIESSALHGQQFDGGGFDTTANSMTPNTVTKLASTISAGTGQICLNGGAVSAGGMPTGYAVFATSGIQFMMTTGSTENANGYIRRVRYWPRVLSNAELQSVTT